MNADRACTESMAFGSFSDVVLDGDHLQSRAFDRGYNLGPVRQWILNRATVRSWRNW